MPKLCVPATLESAVIQNLLRLRQGLLDVERPGAATSACEDANAPEHDKPGDCEQYENKDRDDGLHGMCSAGSVCAA